MINGVSLSSIEDINLTYASHYRQLEHIVRKDYSGFTHLERGLAHIVRKRKYNHVRPHSLRKGGNATNSPVRFALRRAVHRHAEGQRLLSQQIGQDPHGPQQLQLHAYRSHSLI
jgi:hypothetical protein